MAASERGLTVGVYRGPYESTNGGQSSEERHFTVVGVIRERGGDIEPMPQGSQVFAPSKSHPAAILRVSALRGAPPHLIPLREYVKSFEPNVVGPMAGGNIADCSDSRWRKLVSSFLPDGVHISAVDIHDRVETQAQYDALSI